MILKYENDHNEIDTLEFDAGQYNFWEMVLKGYNEISPTGEFILTGNNELLDMLVKLSQPLEYPKDMDSAIVVKRVTRKSIDSWGFVNINPMVNFLVDTFPPVKMNIHLFNTVTLLYHGKRIQSILVPNSNIIHVAGGVSIPFRIGYLAERTNAVNKRILHELHAYFITKTNYLVDHSVKEFVRENFVNFNNWVSSRQEG